MHIYLRESPRALLLVTTPEDERLGSPSRGLIFKASENKSSGQVIVEFLPKSEIDLGDVARLTNRSVHGCLGLLNVANGKSVISFFLSRLRDAYKTFLDIFVAIITSVTFLGNVRPSNNVAENVSRIQEVQFFCINNSAYDDLSALSDALASPSFFDGMEGNRDPYASTASIQSGTPILEHPCDPLTKILGNGTFYYATRSQWDISTRLSARMNRPTHDLAQFDERFIWNEYISRPLLSFREKLDDAEMEEIDRCQFIVSHVTMDCDPLLLIPF